MREILFRGITSSGDMVYGSLIAADDYCCILEREEDVHPMNYPYLDGFIGTFDGKATPVKPETVSQWTGLVDKNGAKIFEGDVVRSDWGYEGLVDYEMFIFASKLCTISDNIEVVGNIWDDPELVSEQSEDA